MSGLTEATEKRISGISMGVAAMSAPEAPGTGAATVVDPAALSCWNPPSE